jgi:hypothetical protein
MATDCLKQKITFTEVKYVVIVANWGNEIIHVKVWC